jgi:hypothetical protein
MESISPMQLILNFILAGVGGFVGVRVALAQLQVNMKTARSEIRILRSRTHRHSTLLTLVAARTGIRVDPSFGDEVDTGEFREDE